MQWVGGLASWDLETGCGSQKWLDCFVLEVTKVFALANEVKIIASASTCQHEEALGVSHTRSVVRLGNVLGDDGNIRGLLVHCVVSVLLPGADREAGSVV